MKKIVTVLLALTFFYSSITNAYACTGVIIGKDLTEDNSTIFARNEDIEPNHNKTYIVHPAKDNKPGDTLVDEVNGFTFILPEKSYKYSSISDVEVKKGIFDEAGFNEYNVAVDATVSMKANDDVLKVDPYVKNGIAESIMTSVILPHAKSAKEAVQLLASIVDTQGASEGNGVVIADNNEIWYMEIYSGHQYAAIKYPSDKFSVIPNNFVLDTIDINDKENTIVSKGLIETVKKANTYVEENSKIHLSKSYGSLMLDTDKSRAYSGILALSPNSKIKYSDERFDFFQTTDKKITIEDVIGFTRNQLENTEFKMMDETNTISDKYKYPISNQATVESHIFQIRGNNTNTMWLSMSNSKYAAYVPFYSSVNDTFEPYKNTNKKYDEKSFYCVSNLINKMGQLDSEFGNKFSLKLKEFEDEMIKTQKENDKKIIQGTLDMKDVTAIGITNSEKAYNMMLETINDQANAELVEKAKQQLTNKTDNNLYYIIGVPVILVLALSIFGFKKIKKDRK